MLIKQIARMDEVPSKDKPELLQSWLEMWIHSLKCGHHVLTNYRGAGCKDCGFGGRVWFPPIVLKVIR